MTSGTYRRSHTLREPEECSNLNRIGHLELFFSTAAAAQPYKTLKLERENCESLAESTSDDELLTDSTF